MHVSLAAEKVRQEPSQLLGAGRVRGGPHATAHLQGATQKGERHPSVAVGSCRRASIEAHTLLGFASPCDAVLFYLSWRLWLYHVPRARPCSAA